MSIQVPSYLLVSINPNHMATRIDQNLCHLQILFETLNHVI